MSSEKEDLKTSISIMSVNSCNQFLHPLDRRGGKRDKRREKRIEREYVLRYLYLTHSLIGAFNPERREIHDGTEKRDMQWERASEGVVRTLLRFPYLKSNLLINFSDRPNRRGKI
jgi:hypothetical protein